MEIPTVQGFADTHMNAQRQKGPIKSYAVEKGSITSYGVQKGSVQVLQTVKGRSVPRGFLIKNAYFRKKGAFCNIDRKLAST